jgi:hypothetical protein
MLRLMQVIHRCLREPKPEVAPPPHPHHAHARHTHTRHTHDTHTHTTARTHTHARHTHARHTHTNNRTHTQTHTHARASPKPPATQSMNTHAHRPHSEYSRVGPPAPRAELAQKPTQWVYRTQRNAPTAQDSIQARCLRAHTRRPSAHEHAHIQARSSWRSCVRQGPHAECDMQTHMQPTTDNIPAGSALQSREQRRRLAASPPPKESKSARRAFHRTLRWSAIGTLVTDSAALTSTHAAVSSAGPFRWGAGRSSLSFPARTAARNGVGSAT